MQDFIDTALVRLVRSTRMDSAGTAIVIGFVAGGLTGSIAGFAMGAAFVLLLARILAVSSTKRWEDGNA